MKEILFAAKARGVMLRVDGENLAFNAPKGALTPELRQAIVEHKAELIAFLKAGDAASRAPILRQPLADTEPGPLAAGQARLWFLDRLVPGSALYNLHFELRMKGVLDVGALRASLSALVERHAMLRAIFPEVEGRPSLVVTPAGTWELPVIDLRGLAPEAREAELRRRSAEHAAGPFDLARGPMMRTTLVSLDTEDHVLLVSQHHIITDGWSSGVFFRDLAELYTAFRAGTRPALPELPVRFSDYARWQETALQGDEEKQAEAWWKETLAALPRLDLPTQRSPAKGPSYAGDAYSFALPAELSAKLKELAGRESCTLYVTLLTVWASLLHRYTQQADFGIGTATAGRDRNELRELVGFFVNTLVLRCDLSGDPDGVTLMHRLRRVAEDALKHQEVPFDRIVNAAGASRGRDLNPLFRASFVLENVHFPDFNLPGLTCSMKTQRADGAVAGTAKFELGLTMIESQGALSATIEYATDLFDAATIERIAGHFRVLAEGLVANPKVRLSQLPLLTEAERRQLLVTWNETAAEFPRERCIHELFEAQVQKSPDAVALVFEGRQLTYRELNERANQLAHHLRALGVGPEVLVGLCVERSLEMVIGLFGILKAGGAYVPLDPTYPADRLAYMVDNAQARVLVTEARLAERMPPHSAHVVRFDADAAELAARPVTDLPAASSPETLVHVLYTSGSTGRPKGVEITQRSVLNLLMDVARRTRLSAEDRVLAVTSLSFDIAALELILPFLVGARVEVASRMLGMDARALRRRLEESGATMMQATPSRWQIVLASGWQGTPTFKILTAGEAVTPELCNQLAARAGYVLNGYGPTETAIYSCAHPLTPTDGLVPIGRPVANTRVYVLDRDLQPVPVGVPGELYIGGIGVARGYRGRPELTAERFINDPFTPGERLYRTGDLCRYRPDGLLDYLGRIDHQVKIRGYRIELGEIETTLSSHAAVKACVVVAREDVPGDRRLVAYVVLGDKSTDEGSLRDHLKQTLPDHMVPSAFVVLDALPLSPNGKVDRQKLPAPASAAPSAVQAPVAPRNELERTLQAIWKEVLRVEAVGLTDNFFDVGGHSLLLSQVSALLHKATGREVSIVELFEHPTIASLARYLAPASETSAAPVRARRRASTSESGVAIIGFSGRFPGAEDLDAFWKNLAGGVESTSFFTEEELGAAGVAPHLLSDPTYVKAKGVLRGADEFDASFFKYSPREAAQIDPQHRVFLECAWEALESAGTIPEANGPRIGVFAGASGINGLRMHESRAANVGEFLQSYYSTGADFLATRVSYKLDLKGPSLTVQTACSTSLVAVHLACRSLLDGECEMALAGGVSITLPLVTGYPYQEGLILSPDGHCRAFDEKAQGTLFGNGVGVVLLKRLEDALADGDTIHAVIRASAINNDGAAKVGYTAPSVAGQAEVISQALAAANVTPEDIGYVEAHGTATPLGDPIEVAALTRVFRQSTQRKGFCALGTVKSNFGHLDAAAGIAGLLKAVLSLKHRQIPPSLHFERPNPNLGLADSPFYVSTQLTDWPSTGKSPRRAGVSSFGIGGTNAHVVVEEAPEVKAAPSAPERAAELFVLSAKTASALDAQAARLAAHVKENPEQGLGDVAFSLATTRAAMEQRLAVVASSREALLETLDAAAKGETPTGVVRGATSSVRGKVAFLFTGQGAQVAGMGRGLHAAWPAFREAFDRCVALFDGELKLERPLREVMWAEPGSADAGLLDQTGYTQPALFTVEYALWALWRSWGVEPELVAGHSIGELVAAHVAGVFSLEDAVRLVAARGRLMQALPSGGAMVSIAAAEEEVAAAVKPHAATVSIAAVNGPKQVVIAGEAEAVKAIAAEFSGRGVRTKALTVSHAFHSPLMAPMLAGFQQVAEKVKYQAATLPLVSNVSGKLAGGEVGTAAYWVRHVREAVRFADGVKALDEAGAGVFVEVGPKATLLGMVPACLPEAKPEVVASLRSGRDEAASILEGLAGFWATGGAPRWASVFPSGGQRVRLPTYSWQRERFQVVSSEASVAQAGEPTGHPLLGVKLPVAGTRAVFESVVGLDTQGWLGDHRVAGQTVVPGAAIAELVRAAASHEATGPVHVTGLVLQAPLMLAEKGARRLQVVLTETEGVLNAAVYSRPAEGGSGTGWTQHATATVSSKETVASPLDLAGARARCAEALDVAATYATIAQRGLAYGPAFQGMRSLWRGESEALAEIVLPESARAEGYGVHPALLDAALQAVAAATPASEKEELFLPFEIGGFFVHQPGAEAAWVHVRLQRGAGVMADVTLTDASGTVVAEVKELRFRQADKEALRRVKRDAPVEAFYRLEWRETPLAEAPPVRAEGSWVVVASPESSLASELVARLGRGVVVPPSGVAAALAAESAVAGVVCLWQGRTGEAAPVAAQRVAAEGLAVVQALRGGKPVRLWWVTPGAVAVESDEAVDVATATAWGLGRTVSQEHPELGCTLVDVTPGAGAVDALVREFGSGSDENQVAWRGGRRHAARLVRAKSADDAMPGTEDYQLQTRRKGTLDALHLAPAECRAPAPGEVQLEVRASGLNFRDVLNALGMYPGEAGPLGSECAGEVVAIGEGVQGLSVGDAVMAMAPGTFRRFVTVDARLVAPVPAGLSFEQAATIPIAFLTAWYALHDLGALKPGERLLVHAAAGGVGMAAVQIGRMLGAEVVATASPSKWDVVRSLGVTQLASSRTVEFASALRQASGGKGVDVVLNALAGEFVDASLSLLSAGGRMLEMGKTDLRDPAAVAAKYPGVSYQVFDMADAGPVRIGEMLAAISAAFAAGHLRPHPVKTFPITEAETAFRFMGQAKHVGKLALMPPRPSRPPANGSVLVTGGLGALGLHVAKWLATEGAAHLVLTGRRGLETPGAAEAVAELEKLGARVTVAAVDVADRQGLAAVLRALPAELPLRGVIHAAGVLDDGVLAEQNAERFARVLAPKVDGTWNLHELTASADLAFFVMFSSVSGLLGAAGQSNYAAANTFLDALAAHRRSRGLPAQSLAWGAWAEGGMASGNQARLARKGIQALTAAEGVALLGQALSRSEEQLAVVRLDLEATGRALTSGSAVPPLWRALVRASAPQGTGSTKETWSARLAGLPPARRAEEVRAAVRAEVARVLSLDTVPADRPMQELGLDSLMAVELRNALGRRVGASLPATLAFDYPTVDALTQWLLQDILVVKEAEAPRPVTAAPRASSDEPIAIIGMGCRFPGGVSDPESYWRLLDEGLDAITEVPRTRWDVDALYDPNPDAPGKMATRSGGFLSDIDQFDPAFFGISPREATAMDPQQRLLLETSWEALERAGLSPEKLMGSDTGVFVGHIYREYATLGGGGLEALDGYVGSGAAASVASGRISYVLGLKGPSLTVDTACSSSLVTVHLACQALRNGECSTALAGGVAVMLTPASFVEFSRLRGLAPDGRCKPFAASADGAGWSEGCGMIVLKRLSDAQRDGDPILAVIRGTAVNQDGRSNGLTAPNGPSQQAVIRRALEQAGLTPADVDYVECHGTGTKLGDPIEVQALGAALAPGRAADKPVVIGSVKSNIGHTQSAAGVAGIIKVVLSLRHGRIPKSLHFDAPSPHIPWAELPVKVAAEPVEWPRNGTPRRAGVSSFGISGTNAHAVLEEAPMAPSAPAAPARATELFVLSGKSQGALEAQAAQLAKRVEANPEQGLGDVAFSLATTRAPMDQRLAVVAGSRDGLRAALEAVAKGQTPVGAVRGRLPIGGVPKVVFVFPGQGSQWLGMGRKLLAEEPAFREALEACDKAIQAEVGWSLLKELAADESTSQLGRIDVVQPVLFAVEVALAALWRAWGVEPDAVVGHSMGEVAAAYVAGALSLEDAVAIICRRSVLLRRISGQGEMAVVELSRAEAEAALVGYEDRLSVAVSNSPRSTVLAGDSTALAEVLTLLEAKKVFCRRVKVDVASHSPQVDPLREDLLAALRQLAPKQATVAMLSTVTGELLEGGELVASYWADNLRQPVRFGDAVKELLDGGHGLFIEMSPHPILTMPVEEIRRASGKDGAALGSLRRGQDERSALLETLGALWTQGYSVAWERQFPAGCRRVALPTYAWQRERYWVEAQVSVVTGAGRRGHAGGHPLLGEGLTISTQAGTRLWETTLDVQRLPWLGDHRVQGAVVLPGTAYLEMALSSGAEALGDGPLELANVVFADALTLASDAAVQVQVVTTEEQSGRLRFQVASRASGSGATSFRVRARGALRRAQGAEAPAKLDVAALRARLGAGVAATETYAKLSATGLEYGPAFQGMTELWRGEGEALGRVQLPEAAGSGTAYRLHPALLDACFHVTGGIFASEGEGATWMPVEVGSLRLWQRPSGELWCHARRVDGGTETVDRRGVDLRIVDATGAVVAELSGLVVQRRSEVAVRREEDNTFLELDWERAAVGKPRLTAGRWLLLGGGAFGEALRSALEAAGHAVKLAPVDEASSTGLRSVMANAFGGQAPTAVVHLGSLDAGRGLDLATVEAALVRGGDSVLATVQAVTSAGFRDAPRLWVLTRGAQAVGAGEVSVAQAPVLGLCRTLAMEHMDLRCASVDLDPSLPNGEVDALVAELLADDAEDEIAFRGGERRVARLVQKAPEGTRREKLEPAGQRAFRLESDEPGVLEHLVLRATERRPPGPGEVEIAVEAAGLGFLDVLLATGVVRDDARGPTVLGGECAGRIVAVGEGVTGLSVGQPVIALANGAVASHVTTSAVQVLPRPSGLSAVEAAAMPIACVTAWYALARVARLQKGERVLIHAATGGVGLAAVRWAQHVGAEVYATAGTPEKRAYLESLGIKYVSDSRSDRFVTDVREWTGGEGVDVVLNSLSGELIDRSFELLRDDGRFVELGKRDSQLGLPPFLRNLSFSLVDLRGMLLKQPARVRALFEEVSRLFEAKVFTAPPITSLPISQAPEAFRKMVQAQHLGKVVLTVDGAEVRIRVPAVSGASIRSDGSYLVTGGLGGLGLGAAGWLAQQGAGHLVLVGRTGASTPGQQAAIAALKALGAKVTVAKADVAERAQLERVLADIAASGMPLRGVLHAAGVADDGPLAQQTQSRLRKVMAPKVRGALHLHELTRQARLDFFVLYASGAGLLGSPQQGTASAANAFLDALAHHRRAQGLPALGIDWGTFAEVGMAAAQESRGVRGLSPGEGLTALARLLDSERAQVAVVPLDIRRWVEFFPAAASSRRLSRLAAAQRSRTGRGEGNRDLLQRLAAADPRTKVALVQDCIGAHVAQVLRLPEARLDMGAPLTSLGMDSLMGLELRNRIEAALGITVPATLLWTYPTVAALSEHLVRLVGGPGAAEVTPPPAPEPEKAPTQIAQEVAQLDEAGLLALLDEEFALAKRKRK
nr:non-ribosomal peptide synthetase/type I polyketide synthase [Pyxidicoccus fallax]